MPFLGVSPTQEFTSVAKQTITGDGSTSYTLNKGVSTENDLAVFVNDVRQEPGVAYTASANTITFTANLESTDSCYVLHIGRTFSSAESPGIEDNATSKVVTIQSDGHIVPTANVTYDLGTSDLRFRDLYLSGSSLHLGAHEMTANATHVSMGNVATTGVMSGNAALMTSLNADELTSGTLPLARLPDDVTIVNDLTIGGDFVVNGNTTTIAANELKVEDSLIQLATNNEISDTIDIGFVGHYSNDGGTTALHTGFFRDASDEQYYLFNGYEDDTFDTATPPSTIDRTANTFSLAPLNVSLLKATGGSEPYVELTPDGSLGNAQIKFDGTDYTIVSNSSSAKLKLATNSTDRLTILHSGEIGFGTSPSGANYHFDSNATNITFRLENSTNDNGYIQYSADGTMRFYTGTAGGSTNIRTVIDATGNVGIGQSSPDYPLHITSTNVGPVMIETTSGSGSYIRFRSSTTAAAPDNVWIGASGNDTVFFANNTLRTMTIDSSGNVGIGVASPSKRLDVYAAAPSGGVIAKLAGGTSGGWLQIADSNGSWQIGSTSRGLEFYSDSTSAYRMALSSSGNLGIGTATPRSTLDLGADSSGGTQISWHSSSTRSLGNIWTSNNGGRLTFGQALKGSTATNNGYLGSYTGTWAPTAMELSYGVINLFADAAQSLTYGGAFTPTQVAKFHHNSGFTSYKTIRTEFAGNTEHLSLYNTGASKWSFYSYNDGHMYINCLPSGGSDATRFTIKSDGSVGIGTAAPAKLLHVVTNGGFRLTDSANYSHIHIGSPDLYVRYPYYRIDSFKTDGSGYFWAFAHHNATSGAKSINMMISDGTNPYGFFKNNLYVGTFTSNEYNGSYPAIATPAAIRGTANSTSFVGGDGTGHFAVGTNSVKTGVTAAGVVTSTLGPLMHGKTQGSHASSEPRCILGWYTYAGPFSNSGSYLHMKTNLWAGGGGTGNTEYTMSLFRYRGYCYTGSPNGVGQGMVGWHNWNGSLPNMTVHNDTSWSIAQSSYVSSDGYCVLVAYMPAAYAQIIIDWDQWGGYDFRERRVTASTQSSSSTGAY